LDSPSSKLSIDVAPKGRMEFGYALQIFVNGLSLSFTYALMAIGLSLVFGVLRVFNFAHGELLMIGGYAVWVLFAANGVPFPIAAIAAAALVAGVALTIERGFFRPTRTDPFRGFIISLGLMSVIQVIALLIFGPLNKTVPTIIPGRIEFLSTSFSIQRLILMPVTATVIAGVWFFLERTRLGRAVRACIEDREAASLQGISQKKLSTLVMAIAGGLAGLAGGIISQGISINAYFGANFIIKAFIVVVVGGMGSIGGTMVASLLFGFLDSTISSLINPRIIILVDVVVLLFILAFKPRGFFGRE